MALVQGYVPFRVVLQDRGSNKTTLNFKSTCTTSAGASTLLNALMAALPAITQCKILKIGYSFDQIEDDDTPLTTNGEAEEKAEISVALVREGSGPGQTTRASITIPAPVPGLFQQATGPLYNVVDPADADLQTFLGLFEAGFGVAGALTLSDYQTILDPAVAGNVRGKRIHKGSRQG